MGGISLLLIPRNSEGIRVRRLPTQGWWTSNTCHILFEDVHVPAKYLIGIENQGFKMIMHNFNHERFMMIAMSNRGSRGALAQAIEYARSRTTFGKRLIDHQVIRHKIAEMASRIEMIQAQLEFLTYQIKSSSSVIDVGYQLALLKVLATRTMDFCAREASQIFGGNSYLLSGVGESVERFYRSVRVSAIGGGSEEVMLDLATKLAKL